ncbi:photosynthetic complex putative assembly protein PuhB [Hydrogenophaga sp. PBL-H3]|uniref:photosynthetic complex putative assembly protein PuhB n=1 Tax=Hydrogenophaga sp. PBL-H3 TaxID=434010 RepID=UPI00131FC3C9|nr:photosynthetic complex putative assembly protein PuhB [Hydrogenophaga sp. PBL-H3]QHE76946.1 PH domain-containing protein [Hydrogenophaga sp. PBL-H3]QHE81370.1 PH domain-containing protein [Hydrogenophaga sp. PBL-H3]
MNAHHEHEFEAAPGLPEPLPQGERLLWQGSPDWRTLAIHAFHMRKLAIYFAGMLGLQWLYLLGEPGGAVLMPLFTSATLATVALGLLSLTAWFSARTTLYTLTDRRILMRIGIVLTLTFNLPLRKLAAAAIRPQAGGHGDIALTLTGEDRIAWLNLWPHARPWLLRQPQPSLRCVNDAQKVGELIVQAWSARNADAMAIVGGPSPAPVRQPRELATATA